MKFYLIILLGLITTSCHLEISNRRVIRNLNNHPDVYADLVSKINSSDSIRHNGTLINFSELPVDIVKVFAKTVLKYRVNYISIDKLACGNISIEIYIGNKHLVYSGCPDSSFPEPNTFEKSGFIEVWGINKNWYLLIDNDFI